ncbi:type IV pilus modification protein PilV [Marinospirillum insulare]|uniref:Type IV pilus assembly protein PilV n=1 Tax=Marinospirillum insulare TaxID=217169 RepID=A0ABQ5ZW70_9GAMM|nr:type IV pilus modification protein PilV [Marinospirillum insulare]GLR63701.1 hypothetical protein GCM10007878_11360 [Marinospirillum insulare]
MQPAKKQQGITLIEVMVAALVITLGLMGIVNLQVKNQAQAFVNYQRTLAGLYAQDLQNRLRADTCVLDKGFNDQYAAWKKTHFKGASAGWGSSLTATTKTQAENNGYWTFELTIEPSSNQYKVQQTLIVQYKDDCVANNKS